jgi:hypothetical protein
MQQQPQQRSDRNDGNSLQGVPMARLLMEVSKRMKEEMINVPPQVENRIQNPVSPISTEDERSAHKTYQGRTSRSACKAAQGRTSTRVAARVEARLQESAEADEEQWWDEAERQKALEVEIKRRIEVDWAEDDRKVEASYQQAGLILTKKFGQGSSNTAATRKRSLEGIKSTTAKHKMPKKTNVAKIPTKVVKKMDAVPIESASLARPQLAHHPRQTGMLQPTEEELSEAKNERSRTALFSWYDRLYEFIAYRAKYTTCKYERMFLFYFTN